MNQRFSLQTQLLIQYTVIYRPKNTYGRLFTQEIWILLWGLFFGILTLISADAYMNSRIENVLLIKIYIKTRANSLSVSHNLCVTLNARLSACACVSYMWLCHLIYKKVYAHSLAEFRNWNNTCISHLVWTTPTLLLINKILKLDKKNFFFKL